MIHLTSKLLRGNNFLFRLKRPLANLINGHIQQFGDFPEGFSRRPEFLRALSFDPLDPFLPSFFDSFLPGNGLEEVV
jgi:hypothetical protein